MNASTPHPMIRGATCGRRRWWQWLALGWLALGTCSLPTQAAGLLEYQIKAAFLFNFTQFVEWPTNSLPNPDSPMVIGILGNDPFGKTLDVIVQGEKAGAHPLAIRRFTTVEEVRECHVLFISQSEGAQLKNILGHLKGKSILTVGETEGFARQGGMIRFITQNHKTRLRINAEAAREARMTLSSKLLKLAEIVSTDQN